MKLRFFLRCGLPVLALGLLLAAFQLRAWSWPGSSADVAQSGFQQIDLRWHDTQRTREVPALLFLPASRPAGKLPLVVFSHGIGSARDGYSYLGRFWARQGFASLHLQHVGSDRSLWEGDPRTVNARLTEGTGDTEAVNRALDLRFALDQLLSGPQGAQFDPARIVAAGHSYGANTTLLVAGARVVRAGRVVQLRDPRIGAAIVISAPPFYGEQDFDPILSDIRIPTLHITTMDDVIHIPGFESGVADRLKVFDAIGGFKVLAVYKHGSHNVFTELRYFDSLAVASAVKTATEDLSLAFLKRVLDPARSLAGLDELAGWGHAHRQLLADYVLPPAGGPERLLGSR